MLQVARAAKSDDPPSALPVQHHHLAIPNKHLIPDHGVVYPKYPNVHRQRDESEIEIERERDSVRDTGRESIAKLGLQQKGQWIWNRCASRAREVRPSH